MTIYATYSNQVIETSLGHYMTPIVAIFLGVFILKESIQKHKIIASLFAIIGVILLTIKVGKIPLIALLLIFTFAFYAYLKKVTKVNVLLGLTVEIIILFPFALFYLISLELKNKVIFF